MSIADLFKVNDYKNKIEELTKQNSKLKSDLELQKDQTELKLSLQQMKPIELNNLIQEKQLTIQKLEDKYSSSNQELKQLNSQLNSLKTKINEIRADISDLSPDLEMSSYGVYKPQYDFATSLGYKDRLQQIRQQQKDMIKSGDAAPANENWEVNGSAAQGRKMNRNNIKALLRSFNNECTDAINKVTYSNLDRIKTRITRSFEQHNKMYSVVQVRMTQDYLTLKLAELQLAFEYKQKVQDEKDQLREQRAREKEEKALQREIKAQQKSLDKEINHYSKAIDELEQKKSANPDDQKLISEIEKLKSELAEYHKKKSEVDYREANATAGYVYIISNIGSFGKNVFKIGVTRRLEPMDRINELGSASVPFKFDVHALIFSENAYGLETELHNRFSKNRVNLVNNRKEYFHITIEEIEKELQKYSNVTVDFNEVPEAEEYRESLAAAKIS